MYRAGSFCTIVLSFLVIPKKQHLSSLIVMSDQAHQEVKISSRVCASFTQFETMTAGASFQLFLGGGQIFFLFFNATGLLKNWKKQHFICSNLTLFIVPFFLFSLFFLFFSLFSFFSFFFSFFLFPWGTTAPSPPQMTPLNDCVVSEL